jgi:hypothetical protein
MHSGTRVAQRDLRLGLPLRIRTSNYRLTSGSLEWLKTTRRPRSTLRLSPELTYIAGN